MRKKRMAPPVALLALALSAGLLAPGGAHAQGLVHQWLGHEAEEECVEVRTVKDLAALIDKLDKELYRHGKVAVKSPDVWGQNRMTRYRAEFEDQMAREVPKFELMIQSYLRRSDQAALTTATTVGAAVVPSAGGTTSSSSSASVTIPGEIGIPGNLVKNANDLIGSMSGIIKPGDVTGLTLANSESRQGIGLEPTVVLDQRARYLNHLHELRRINAGDDSTDAPGYGLYLLRMPVSLLPGPQSEHGKGASVTLQAAYSPSGDLLPVTFRNVVILDTTYQLKDFLTKALHKSVDLSKPPATSSA
ncbi:MAG: hypothetical protein U0835_18005, partial [Isosphaeraceae bacterium]